MFRIPIRDSKFWGILKFSTDSWPHGFDSWPQFQKFRFDSWLLRDAPKHVEVNVCICLHNCLIKLHKSQQNRSKTLLFCTENCAFSEHFFLFCKHVEFNIRNFSSQFSPKIAQISAEFLKNFTFLHSKLYFCSAFLPFLQTRWMLNSTSAFFSQFSHKIAQIPEKVLKNSTFLHWKRCFYSAFLPFLQICYMLNLTSTIFLDIFSKNCIHSSKNTQQHHTFLHWKLYFYSACLPLQACARFAENLGKMWNFQRWFQKGR